jgi:hypothetical protein
MKFMPTPKLTPEIINAAIEGFQQAKVRTDAQIAELRAMLPGGRTELVATPEAAPPKREVSAAARRRMALGQQKRWAAIKGTTESPSSPVKPEPSKPKRKLSAAGKAAIVAALKKRWAANKAAAKKAAAKKTAAKTAPMKKAAKKSAAKKAAKAPVKTETQPTA